MLARVIGIDHATTFSFISDPALTFDFAFYAHSVASGLDEPAPYQKTLLFPQRNRSEEHTSELQSRLHLVCRLLLEKKKKKKKKSHLHVTVKRQINTYRST